MSSDKKKEVRHWRITGILALVSGKGGGGSSHLVRNSRHTLEVV